MYTPSGLSEWFADNVNSRGEDFTFIWDDSEEYAKLLQKKTNEKVRYRWMNDEDDQDDCYFEFKIVVDEITKDVCSCFRFCRGRRIGGSKNVVENSMKQTSFRRFLNTMYFYQGQCYASLNEVPAEILSAFIHHTALTETIVFQKGKPLFWEEHYLRLMASMRILRMEIPLSFTMEQLQSDMASLCLAEGQSKFTGSVQLRVAKTAVPSREKTIPSTVYTIELRAIEDPFSWQQQELPIDLSDHYLARGFIRVWKVLMTWRNTACTLPTKWVLR